MKFVLGKPPASDDFTPSEGAWIRLKEPASMWILQLASLPIGLALVAAMLLLAAVLGLPGSIVIDGASLAALPLIIPAHELLHGLAYPVRLSSPRVMLGFWPSSLVFYAHFNGEIARARFLAVLLAPLFVLSVLPLLILKLAGGHGAPFIMAASAMNAFVSCGDVFGALLILFQVPRGAVIRNQGWKTYWTVRQAASLQR
ncbi:MAG: DUF3267 domain-containing protein [Firmicutes bacterium]|nr:DUF3267 domain-containing protein [Bacillota bacterium]